MVKVVPEVVVNTVKVVPWGAVNTVKVVLEMTAQ